MIGGASHITFYFPASISSLLLFVIFFFAWYRMIFFRPNPSSYGKWSMQLTLNKCDEACCHYCSCTLFRLKCQYIWTHQSDSVCVCTQVSHIVDCHFYGENFFNFVASDCTPSLSFDEDKFVAHELVASDCTQNFFNFVAHEDKFRYIGSMSHSSHPSTHNYFHSRKYLIRDTACSYTRIDDFQDSILTSIFILCMFDTGRLLFLWEVSLLFKKGNS